MTIVVTKSISTDFPEGKIHTKQLHRFLKQAYADEFLSMNTRGDVVTILLLDGADTLYLDTIVANFAVDESYNTSFFIPITNYPSPENKGFFQQWQMMSFFTFSGTLVSGIPNHIEIFSSISDDAVSGSVRLYDSTNRVTIAEQEIASKTTQKYTITVPDNIWPRELATIEIHCKVTATTIRDYIIVNAVSIL